MRSSAKNSTSDNNRGLNGHVLTLHQRLYHALNLGSWENGGKWKCSDIEIQRLVLRSVDAFLECISSVALHHPLVKDSVVDMVRALTSILEFKNQSILSLASTLAVKVVNILPSTMLQVHVFDLLCPLADLICSRNLQVAALCAAATNVVLSKISSRQEREVWKILDETKAVDCIVRNIRQFCVDEKPIQYFQEMASVLSKIFCRWPSSRFCAWNDSDFLNALDVVKLLSENSMKVAVLQLYSSIALCSTGAVKLLENGEALLEMMLCCMESSNTSPVRVEAFKLARCLALSRRGRTRMMNICCQPLVKALINAMDNWRSHSDKFDKGQLSVMEEACRLTSVICWAGDHHILEHFWKDGIERLLDLLLESKIHQMQHDLSLNDLLVTVQKSYNANFLLPIRPYVWDILGGLAANCAENINHKIYGNELRLNVLVICACISFINLVGTLRQVSQKGLKTVNECESASRVVLMLVYSPCKYVASLARSILCEILKLHDKDYVEYFLEILNAGLTGNKLGLPGNLQMVVSLMSLACYSSLPEYQELIIKYRGLKTVVAFIMWWLKNPVRLKRASLVPHLHDLFSERSCCIPGIEEWEGVDMILLFTLWILSELLHHLTDVKIPLCYYLENFSEVQLTKVLEDICSDNYSHGSRWHAARALSYFGHFGFQSRLGKRIVKLLGEKEHSDLKLVLVNGEFVHVHEVILKVICPLLLPPGKSEKSANEASTKSDLNTVKTVHLSAHVDQQSLLKLLQYIYSGYLQADESLVKKLKIFARHCKLESLLQMLSRRCPRWGVPLPSFDLSHALAPAGHNLSNLIFESSSTRQLVNWTCRSCSSLVPHLHVHKVIVESSCDYLRALFQSGMQESHLQIVSVPTSWESLNKLVSWFYSDRLPVPSLDCVWHNMEADDKYSEIQTYIELCWLSEFWLIEELHEECYRVVVSCLESSRDLSTKIIQTAANLSQWSLAQIAANYMAPSYHHLRNSGELDALDDNLIEMVRAASVRLSQEGSIQ